MISVVKIAQPLGLSGDCLIVTRFTRPSSDPMRAYQCGSLELVAEPFARVVASEPSMIIERCGFCFGVLVG